MGPTRHLAPRLGDIRFARSPMRNPGPECVSTKENFKEGLTYMTRQAVKAGVTIKMEKAYSSALLKELEPEVVIVATGSRPLIPDIPGIDQENVVTALDVFGQQAQIGKRVLVIGGGLIGLEVADYLALRGRRS